jgi:regulator of protease activity HflC (stomatin/prohibitin superfamily)
VNITSLFQGIAVIAWLAFVALLVAVFSRASRGQKTQGISTALIALLVIAILLTSVGAGLVFVEPDQIGMVVTILGSGGIRPEPLSAGLHWIVPFAERVERYSIRNQTYTMSVATGEGAVQGDDSIQVRTKDGQQVYIDASVIYAIDKAQAVSLYKTWGTSYEDGLVRPTARGIIRDAASQYGVEEIVSSKRAEMEDSITKQLEQTFAENNLILRDFVLRNVRFSDEYAAAVEQKQIAEQQAQQAKFVVEQRKQEAEQARQVAQGSADAAVIAAKGAAEAQVVQAQAQAQSNDLITKSLTPELLQYQYITKLAPGVQTIFVPSGNQFILPLPNVTGQ